jgi:hypothetical protein
MTKAFFQQQQPLLSSNDPSGGFGSYSAVHSLVEAAEDEEARDVAVSPRLRFTAEMVRSSASISSF